jgi:DUF1365 family protein
MELRSCLYECVIVHRRLRPKPYAFEHGIMMLYADLDELPAIHRRTRLLSYGRRNLYSFRDADYFPTATQGPLKSRVIAYLAARAVQLGAGGRIQLLTLPRVLGYIFNPLSIYFCFDERGTALCAIAEVGNTFRESKLYLLPWQPTASQQGRFHLRVPKEYYVSPFSALDVCFDFDCRAPAQTLQVHIEDWDPEGKLLVSHLRGSRLPLCDYQLLRFAAKFPALTLKVIGLIHWHALRLALKRVPWHRKAAQPHMQREVLHPHSGRR